MIGLVNHEKLAIAGLVLRVDFDAKLSGPDGWVGREIFEDAAQTKQRAATGKPDGDDFAGVVGQLVDTELAREFDSVLFLSAAARALSCGSPWVSSRPKFVHCRCLPSPRVQGEGAVKVVAENMVSRCFTLLPVNVPGSSVCAFQETRRCPRVHLHFPRTVPRTLSRSACSISSRKVIWRTRTALIAFNAIGAFAAMRSTTF